MKSNVQILVLIVLFALSAEAEDRPTIESIVGEAYFVEDRWAGQSFTLGKEGKEYYVIWRIHGSGRPILSEERYPAEIRSDWQVVSPIGPQENSNELMVEITGEGKVRAYLNGIRICITKGNT